MTVKERILILRLLEKSKANIKKSGLQAGGIADVEFSSKESKNN